MCIRYISFNSTIYLHKGGIIIDSIISIRTEQIIKDMSNNNGACFIVRKCNNCPKCILQKININTIHKLNTTLYFEFVSI